MRAILFHRCGAEAADAILRSGFRDGVAYEHAERTLQGVWLSDAPLDVNESIAGDALLVVDISKPEGVLDTLRLTEEGEQDYLEWCVPADWLNERCTVYLLDESTEDAQALIAAGRVAQGLCVARAALALPREPSGAVSIGEGSLTERGRLRCETATFEVQALLALLLERCVDAKAARPWDRAADSRGIESTGTGKKR